MKRKAPKESTLKGKGLSMPFPLKYPLSPNDQRSVTFGNPILLFFYLSLFLSILLIIDIVVIIVLVIIIKIIYGEKGYDFNMRCELQ